MAAPCALTEEIVLRISPVLSARCSVDELDPTSCILSTVPLLLEVVGCYESAECSKSGSTISPGSNVVLSVVVAVHATAWVVLLLHLLAWVVP